MRRRGRWSAATLAVGALLFAFFGPAAAMSCSERLQICHGYCIKSMADRPGCHDKCREFHAQCLSSGCWESRVVAKQCNFVRQ